MAKVPMKSANFPTFLTSSTLRAHTLECKMDLWSNFLLTSGKISILHNKVFWDFVTQPKLTWIQEGVEVP